LWSLEEEDEDEDEDDDEEEYDLRERFLLIIISSTLLYGTIDNRFSYIFEDVPMTKLATISTLIGVLRSPWLFWLTC
jgi:hypothetical protein